MIRSFVYGFFFCLIFSIAGVLFVGILNTECIYYEKIEREEREIRTIGSLIGFLCSCITIGWLVYCFKF